MRAERAARGGVPDSAFEVGGVKCRDDFGRWKLGLDVVADLNLCEGMFNSGGKPRAPTLTEVLEAGHFCPQNPACLRVGGSYC